MGFEVWIVIVLAAAGLSGFIGYAAAKRGAPKQAELDALATELEEARQQAESVQANVSEHFEQSAMLFGKLAADYREFLNHFESSAQNLGLSEARARELIEQGFQPLLTHEEASVVAEAEAEAASVEEASVEGAPAEESAAAETLAEQPVDAEAETAGDAIAGAETILGIGGAASAEDAPRAEAETPDPEAAASEEVADEERAAAATATVADVTVEMPEADPSASAAEDATKPTDGAEASENDQTRQRAG